MALRVEERIVAGGDGDRLIVHHLVLRGGNRAIGRHLGEIARARHRWSPPPAPDALRVRVQREWVRRHAAGLFERMRGAADAFGVDLADDAWDVSRLGAPPAAPGCSAVFVPPRATASGHPLVSRAFDFAAPLEPAGAGGPAHAGRPYVLETWPDEGHPSLAVVAFDLLGGVLDGVNAEGLCVVASGDAEAGEAGLEPDPGAVGLDELQAGRFLLDTCATAIDAREALLQLKQPYAAFPVHWLVADRHGDAFTFEWGRGRNRVHLVEAAGAPLALANHPLHRYPGGAGLPRGDGPAGSYARWRTLAGALAEAGEPWTRGSLGLAARRAFAGPEQDPHEGGVRTLWHGIYDLRDRSLEATFWLRDERVAGGAPHAVRTEPIRFAWAAEPGGVG